MGRTLKRVPLDFAWPQGEIWEGYINPYNKPCPNPDCEAGYTSDRKWLQAITHLLLMTGEAGIENRPLHPWLQDITLRPKQRPTPEMAKLTGGLAGRPPQAPFGHDALDTGRAERKIIEAAGLDANVWGICPTCKGHAIDPLHWEAYEAWQDYEPPTGEGYQLWETTTEGSPDSPVFATLDELCAWCAEHATTFGSFTASAEEWRQMLDDDFVHHEAGNNIFL